MGITFEDKLNYDLEENRRLIEEGDPDAVYKEKLSELNLCEKNGGQCNLFCKNYNNCIVISN